jgi:hypothetical protein
MPKRYTLSNSFNNNQIIIYLLMNLSNLNVVREKKINK